MTFWKKLEMIAPRLISSSIQTPPAWILCLNRNPNLKRVHFKRLVNYRTRHSFSKHLLINCPLLPMPPTCYSLIWNEIFKGILASLFCKSKLRVHLSMCGSLHSSYASAVLCGLPTLKKTLESLPAKKRVTGFALVTRPASSITF